MANAWRSKKRPDEAIAEYREALRRSVSRPAEVHFQIGTLLRDQNDTAGALAEFEEALRLAPDDSGLANRIRRLKN